MKLVIISKMRGGKDTVADYLSLHHNAYRFAFGDALKRYAKLLFPEQFQNGNKPRKLLQQFGQLMREIDPDIWVRLAMENVQKAEQGGMTHFICSDCRQMNEYKTLKETGFTFIRLETSEQVRIQRMKEKGESTSPELLNHETESFVDSFECEYTIDNNGSLSDTYEQLEKILSQIRS